MSDVFISYSRKDARFARQLAVSLTRAGIDVWIDVDDIPVGTKWSTAVMQGLRLCQVMIVVISPAAMNSRNVEDEWQYFLDKNKPVVPVLLRPTDIHFQLNRIQRIDFHTEDYDTALQYLFLELESRKVQLAPGAIVARPTVIGRRPFPNSHRLALKNWRIRRLLKVMVPYLLIIMLSSAFIIWYRTDLIQEAVLQNAGIITPDQSSHAETRSSDVLIHANYAVNIRLGDDPGWQPFDVLETGEEARLLGINRTRTWYYIEFTDTDAASRKRGWVYAPFVTANGDIRDLPELDVEGAAALP